MNIYEYTRKWWDFAFENPEKVRPNHAALFFFAIEHCNRLGWKNKFGLPSTMAMEAIGISSYNTYIKTFNNLVEWGFIKLIQKSRNQYSSNVISISNAISKNDKALDRAVIKHTTKQSESTIQSTIQSIDSIDILYTNLPFNKYTSFFEFFWKEYERKGSKSLAFKEWKALKIESDEKMMAEMYDHLARYKATERQYRKDAERYLKLKFWEDK